MRKLVYEIKDKDGNIIQTVTTLKEKREAEKNGFKAEDKTVEVDTFQPWNEKKKEKSQRKPSKYHKFVLDKFE